MRKAQETDAATEMTLMPDHAGVRDVQIIESPYGSEFRSESSLIQTTLRFCIFL